MKHPLEYKHRARYRDAEPDVWEPANASTNDINSQQTGKNKEAEKGLRLHSEVGRGGSLMMGSEHWDTEYQEVEPAALFGCESMNHQLSGLEGQMKNGGLGDWRTR